MGDERGSFVYDALYGWPGELSPHRPRGPANIAG